MLIDFTLKGFGLWIYSLLFGIYLPFKYIFFYINFAECISIYPISPYKNDSLDNDMNLTLDFQRCVHYILL